MKTRLNLLLLGLCVCSCTSPRPGPRPAPCCGTVKTKDSFAIVQDNAAAPLWVDAGDFPGVLRAANDLRQDVGRVTGRTPLVSREENAPGANVILIGTIGKNPVIDRMIRENKLDAAGVAGQWESFLIQVVSKPRPGVARALVIAGSDKRGTIYGIYDLSGRIGVSPWYYWADVPVEPKSALFVKTGPCKQGPPSVKYRGLFLNDENPDLTQWVREKYGTVPVPGGETTANYGRGFYTNLFELILRLKGNFLWPAMWNNRFNQDDPENAQLADEYGIVMGTSHQEPMLRAQKEWDWGTNYGRIHGNWNYSVARQQPVLQQFWREGVRRNRNFESIFTLGLRAENDSGAPIGKDLTGEIVNVQRKILAEEVNPDVTKVPQAWCLYKEVQGYYNEGLHPPEDITLLWAEDNWGNVRRLPTADERKRPGGAGIYYHFDYHGGPRSYQWINTSPISKIWDQMSLAKQYGADRIWIVNVGHFKGYEFPLEYFMSLAWDSSRWTNNNLNEFTRLWAARQFGPACAAEIADVLARYSKYNGRRKPELLEPGTYSLEHYQEAERVVADFQAISDQAEKIYHQLPREKQDAFYELVLFPAKASAQLNEMYLAANQNAVYARQGRASANDKAAECRALFQSETNLMADYNHTFAGGKWDHFMDQPFIGYTSWAEPRQGNNLGAIRLKELPVPDAAEMGLALEGGGDALPRFDAFNQQRHYLEVFNKGKTPFAFTAAASDSWITLSETQGTIGKDKRLWLGVDWGKAPKGTAAGTVRLAGVNTNFTVKVEASNPVEVARDSLRGFVEGEGVVAIEPEHCTKMIDSGACRWIKIEDYGRTLSGMRATGPVDAPAATPGKDSPCLEYRMYLFSTGEAEVTTITGPTLNFVPGRDLRFAVSFDDAPPQTVTLVPKNYSAQNGNRDWEASVQDSARVVKTKFTLARPGYHTLKLWMIDPGVVVQKLVVDLGGLKPSYLGPPESYRRGQNAPRS
ncbi:MAG: glycosyl hydrolase 115 family protein [Verrucomicrobiota bacterium]|jgi:hypothetical protein